MEELSNLFYLQGLYCDVITIVNREKAEVYAVENSNVF